jgi:hypothetical protein
MLFLALYTAYIAITWILLLYACILDLVPLWVIITMPLLPDARCKYLLPQYPMTFGLYQCTLPREVFLAFIAWCHRDIIIFCHIPSGGILGIRCLTISWYHNILSQLNIFSWWHCRHDVIILCLSYYFSYVISRALHCVYCNTYWSPENTRDSGQPLARVPSARYTWAYG